MKKSKDNCGMALLTVIALIAIFSVAISLTLTSVKNGIRSGGLINRKMVRENVVASHFERAKLKLQEWGDEIGTYKLNDIDKLTEGYQLKESEGFPAEDGEYLTTLTVKAFPGNPTSLLAGETKKYIVRSAATHKTSGESHVLDATVGIQLVSLTEIGMGVLGASKPGPHNFSNAKFKGHVHFGPGVEPNFLDGETKFYGPVTFEGAAKYTHTSGSSVDFEKGLEEDIPLAASVDPVAIKNQVCDHVSPQVAAWSTLPDDELCLFAKQKLLYRYRCKPKDPATGYVAVGTKTSSIWNDAVYGAVLQSVTIPKSGLVICNKTGNIGIKGIYQGALTIVADKITLWGDLVSKDQNLRSYSAGLIANDVVIPMDVPNHDMLSSWYGNFADAPNYLSERFNGVTNFPNNLWTTPTLIGDEQLDENAGNKDYGTSHAGGFNIPSWAKGMGWLCGGECAESGMVKFSATLDIDAAVLAMNRLDVEGLNPPPGFPGLMIPAIDPIDGKTKFFSSEPFAAPYTDPKTGAVITSIYKDVNGDGKVSLADANYVGKDSAGTAIYDGGGLNAKPLFCAQNQYDPTAAKCAPGRARARALADQLWINGTLIVGDLANTRYSGAGCGGICGFDRKNVNYDPLLELYPPPYFPRLNGISKVLVYSTQTHSVASQLISSIGK